MVLTIERLAPQWTWETPAGRRDPIAVLEEQELGRLPWLLPLRHARMAEDLCNFGFYASPERALLFDIQDCDDTDPGPFESHLLRLVTSLVVASHGLWFRHAPPELQGSR